MTHAPLSALICLPGDLEKPPCDQQGETGHIRE